MERIKKSLVTTGLGVGLLGGATAGLIIGTPLLVSAQSAPTTTEAPSVAEAPPEEKPSVTTETPSTTTTTTTREDSSGVKEDSKDSAAESSDAEASEDRPEVNTAPKNLARDGHAKRSERLQGALKGLVDNGTISQAQADAVIKAIDEARASAKDHWKDREHNREHNRELPKSFDRAFRGMKQAYEALGLTPSELTKELIDGKTLGQIAEERGVDPQTLIDAVVAPLKEQFDRAVEAGRMSRSDADQKLAESTEAVAEAVNNGALPFGAGRFAPGRNGHGWNPHTAPKPGD